MHFLSGSIGDVHEKQNSDFFKGEGPEFGKFVPISCTQQRQVRSSYLTLKNLDIAVICYGLWTTEREREKAPFAPPLPSAIPLLWLRHVL